MTEINLWVWICSSLHYSNNKTGKKDIVGHGMLPQGRGDDVSTEAVSHEL
jgi:hypothetical protein